MIVGVPKEIKTAENRVAITPTGVSALVSRGHKVLVEKGAGDASGILYRAYQAAGATVVETAQEAWQEANLVMKVEEPQPDEFRFLRPELIVFCYLHLAANEVLTQILCQKEVAAIAYETVSTQPPSSISYVKAFDEPVKSAQLQATPKIFLSYARADIERVENLYRKLSEAGCQPWMDTKDILPGERWETAIQKSIRNAEFFLACLSPNSVSKRGFLQKEIKEGLDIFRGRLETDIYLIPVKLTECEVPESLRGFQWVDLFEEDGWTRLLKAIQIGMQRLHEPKSSEQPRLLEDEAQWQRKAEPWRGPLESEGSALPLLAPMSEIAGRLSIQVGAWCLQAENGGRGILLGGTSGVRPGKVVILGAGTAGSAACEVAAAMGATVGILDTNPSKLRNVRNMLGRQVVSINSTRKNVEEEVVDADLVIGAVLIPGAKAPKLLSRGLVKRMKPGAAIVDISIDQGGCAETSRPTTHRLPIYVEEEVVHYCVTNMPASVPRTATYALTDATLPYCLEIANRGLLKALRENLALARGLNTHKGQVTHAGVAAATGLALTRIENVIRP